jgi:hypothetical protein
MIRAMPDSSSARRVDLDWIRILAFLSLILYHVGMYYVTWDWHVKSPFASPALEPLMFLTNPWRLSLLFLVSGVATAFMLRRLEPGALARTRSWRLLVPLVFGMLVIVPPQSYFEVVEKLGYSGTYGQFWLRYLAADHTFCKAGKCLDLPSWNHLWFVAYLWVYTMVLAAIVKLRPAWKAALASRLEHALAGWGVLIWPWLALALARVMLVARFPQTHGLVDDWYNHAQYGIVFAIGFLVATSPGVWQAMERIRWPALLLAFAAYGFLTWYFLFRANPGNTSDALRMFQRGVYALDQWAAIVAACGFAHRHIRHDGPARRYLTDAIFPLYIVHQTAIILFAMAMRPWRLDPIVEGPLLVLATAAACVVTYEIVKRIALLRPLFGLKPG